MSNIEKLYYNMDRLADDYADTKEVIEARESMKNVLGRKMYLEYEDEISTLAVSVEKQGFVAGFQYAVSLLTSGGMASV